MKGICCNQSDRGASQPPQAPRDASLVEHTNDRGAIQPAFDNMCANKINVAIIIIVVQPVCLYRRTPFMISSLHVTKVMMLIMIMTHEEGLWISMQPLCLCRRTPFIITFGVHAGVSQI